LEVAGANRLRFVVVARVRLDLALPSFKSGIVFSLFGSVMRAAGLGERLPTLIHPLQG